MRQKSRLEFYGIMGRIVRIESLLTENFSPDFLEVADESHLHVGHSGHDPSIDVTHIRIRIVSSMFDGLGRIDIHRRVMGCLSSELSSGLHAVSLDARGAA